MTVRSLRNQYRGVNAHLHSYWQAKGGWNNFHNRHIGDLTGILRQQLLPIGYTAYLEESLQIRHKGDTLRESDEETEKPYRAIAVYELEKKDYGEPIAWIELLSPTNKGGDHDAQVYRAKRRSLLESGFIFVEIDYLHETPPTFAHWPDYSKRKNCPSEAHPYRIVVLNPHPNMQSGPAQPYEFDVDARIPSVTIPLKGDDLLNFDFDVCYQKTFEEMVYGLEVVAYDELPHNFQRYSESDQTRIARRMVSVLEGVEKGINLETGPFEVKPLSLDDALSQIKAFKPT